MNKDQLKIIELFRQGLTAIKISAELDIDRRTVSKVLKENGYELKHAPKLSIEIEKEIIKNYLQGLNHKDISILCKIHVNTVAKVLKKNNVSKNTLLNNKRKLTKEQVIKSIFLYKQGLSCLKIAEEFEVSSDTISRLLKENFVEIRSPKDYCKLTKAQEKEIVGFHLKGLKNKEIAQKIDISSSTVLNALRRNGYKLATKMTYESKLFNQDKQKEIVELFYQGTSQPKLCQIFDTSEKTISNIIKYHSEELKQKEFILLSEALKEPRKVYRLNLSNQELSNFPLEIINMLNLETLNLNNNHLMKIPVEIAKLNNLKELNLSSNLLENLPTEISKLIRLEVLQLNDNRLENLPFEIARLNRLKIFDLSHNNFLIIPAAIKKLLKLKRLKLQGNKIKRLANDIFKLTSLEELDLSDNELSNLPVQISMINSLKVLNLKNNSLKQLPEAISELSQLETLELQNNKLRVVPFDLKKLIRLKMLNLNDNSFKEHEHSHYHEETDHDHFHTHDDGHHSHTHQGEPLSLYHSHEHKHIGSYHSHPHTPDIHHLHQHSGKK